MFIVSYLMPLYVLLAWRSAHLSVSSILFHTHALENPLVCLIYIYLYFICPFLQRIESHDGREAVEWGKGMEEGGWAPAGFRSVWLVDEDDRRQHPRHQRREEAQRCKEEAHSLLMSDNLLKYSHVFCSPHLSSIGFFISNQEFELHPHPQPWTTCAAVFLTARSSPTCLMATSRICRNPILPSLLHLGRRPNRLLRSLQARTQTQRENSNLLPSPLVQDSSAPSPM